MYVKKIRSSGVGGQSDFPTKLELSENAFGINKPLQQHCNNHQESTQDVLTNSLKY